MVHHVVTAVAPRNLKKYTELSEKVSIEEAGIEEGEKLVREERRRVAEKARIIEQRKASVRGDVANLRLMNLAVEEIDRRISRVLEHAAKDKGVDAADAVVQDFKIYARDSPRNVDLSVDAQTLLDIRYETSSRYITAALDGLKALDASKQLGSFAKVVQEIMGAEVELYGSGSTVTKNAVDPNHGKRARDGDADFPAIKRTRHGEVGTPAYVKNVSTFRPQEKLLVALYHTRAIYGDAVSVFEMKLSAEKVLGTSASIDSQNSAHLLRGKGGFAGKPKFMLPPIKSGPNRCKMILTKAGIAEARRLHNVALVQ